MNYPETLHYLYEQLPMYQRDGPMAFKKDLSNIQALCDHLDNPQTSFDCIHVAGTNGKGSVSHMLSAILQADGKKVGLYTSPHYKDFRERIKVDGALMSEAFVVAFVSKNKELLKDIQPSFFEITVAMAFEYFKQENVDIAVIETGLGGRLDSTNIVKPLVSVITNIGYDHMQFLGNILPEIAREKAGIIKESIPVVIGETNYETAPVFIDSARRNDSPILFADDLYGAELITKGFDGMTLNVTKADEVKYKELKTDVFADFQLKNIVTTIATIETLVRSGYSINEKAVRQGLATVVPSTKFQGRWQLLQKEPIVVCDSGHNADGLKTTLAELDDLAFDQLHIVIGAVNDKDLTSMLQLLPKTARYYFCKPDIPRGLDAGILQEQASKIGLDGKVYDSVLNAKRAAIRQAKSDDVVFIGGSAFVVAEAL